jgi:enoyl-CoA hydratase/carnithine racemase
MLSFDLADRVAILTLNRPDRRNAFLPRMGKELFDAFARCERSEDVRAIVVTGAGDHFCVGAELTTDDDLFVQRVAEHESPNESLLMLDAPPWSMTTPIIGAINGDAIGIGCTLPLHWDIRLVAEQARLSFAFVRRGVIPERNSHWLLPRLVGYAHAKDLLITGRMFTGEYAARIGLATEALESKQVLPAALEIARDIAQNVSPAAAGITKRLLTRVANMTPMEAEETERQLFKWCAEQQDAKEGVVSFLEKVLRRLP